MIGEAVEEGDRFRGEKVRSKPATRLAWATPTGGQDLAVGRDAGEEGSDVGR
jgi:hypothetical protein